MKKSIWALLFLCMPLLSAEFKNMESYFHKNAQIMLLINPKDAKIVKANIAATKFYGYTRAKLEKMSIKDINTFTPKQVQQEMYNAQKENRNYFIFRHKLKNGQIKRVYVYSKSIIYKNQKLLYSTIQDVSSLELAQKEIDYYNKTLEKQIDLKSKALIQEEIDKNNIYFFGFVVQLIIIILLYINIRRRQKAEKQLAQNLKLEEYSKKQLEDIINSFPISIIKADKEFINIEYSNQSFTNLFGWNKKDLRTVEDFKQKAYPNEEYREEKFAQWNVLVEETKAQNLSTSTRAIEVEVTCKNGDTKLCQLWYYRNEGEYYGIFYDITRQTQLEQQNLEQQKMLLTQAKIAAVGEMLGNIAHQWRQPLSSISSHVSGLQVQMRFGQKVSQQDIETCATEVLNKVNYLSTTIDDFKNFFTSDCDNVNQFNLKETISKLHGLIKDNLNNNYIDCHMDLQDVQVVHNENQLIQCLLNICNNASDAMVLNKIKSDARKLFITLRVKNDMVKIKIKDSGNGIDEEIIDRIFEPYFTTKHKSIGTGIGLYMSYQMITSRFKGTLKATNKTYTHEGQALKGAQFTIEFPVKNDA